LGYLVIGSLLMIPLVNKAMEHGVTQAELIANQYIIFDHQRLEINKNIILLVQFGLFVAAFLGFILSLKFIHHKRFISVLTAFEKFRYTNFFFAFGLWAAILVITMIVSYLTAKEDLVFQFEPSKFLQLFVICIVFLPIQTLTEEVIFRGYLVQGLSQIFKNGIIPIILTSIMFGSAHMSNPEASAYGSGLMFAYYVMFAFFLGAITLMSEGLELAFGIHLANNLLSALMVTSKNSVLKTDAIFYANAENAAAEIVLAICSILAVFIVFWIKYRWKDFALLIR